MNKHVCHHHLSNLSGVIIVQVDGSFTFIFVDDVTAGVLITELDNNDCAFRYDEPPSPGRTEPAKRPGAYTFVCVCGLLKVCSKVLFPFAFSVNVTCLAVRFI